MFPSTSSSAPSVLSASLPLPLSFSGWADRLRSAGLVVLPQSHAVPVDLWVRDAAGRVLHLRARGTRVVLRSYDVTDLTTLLLRAECDCTEHRTAGAAGRVVLAPGARPTAEAVYDGAADAGWTGVAAGLLGVMEAAALFDLLLGRLTGVGDVVESATEAGAGASTVHPHLSSRERSRSCASTSVLPPAHAG